MIRKKINLVVEVTYDPECDMGYVYLCPKDSWPPLTNSDGAIDLIDAEGKLALVCDLRDGRLVGIEFFGRNRIPVNICKLMSEEDDKDSCYAIASKKEIPLPSKGWDKIVSAISDPPKPNTKLKKIMKKMIDKPSPEE